jgi:O-antigen ligase
MDAPAKDLQPVTASGEFPTGSAPSRLGSAVFALLCIVPVFGTILFGAVDSATWVFISIFWVLIVLLWLADSWRAGGITVNTSWLHIPIVGLIVIGMVQLLPLGGSSGETLGVAASRAISLDPYATRFFLIRLVVYLTFFAACLAYVNTERRLQTAVLLIVIFGAVMAFFGILQRLANPDGIYGMRVTPQAIPFGPFVNQHHFAAFMQMTGGLTLALLFGKDTTRDKRLMLAFAFVVMGVAVVLTSSRGGLLGFLAVAAFVGVMSLMSRDSHRSDDVENGSRGKIALAAAGITLVVLIFGTVLFLGGNDSLLRGIGVVNADADISTGRMHFWPIAIRIFLSHPIVGAGFDAFGVAYTQIDTWNGALRVEQAHNEYLQTLADSGIAGIACVAAFIFLLVRNGLGMIARSHGFRHSAAIGAMAGCLGILIHSFFDFPLRTHSNAFFFLLLAAIATVTVASDHHHRHHNHRHRHRRHS